MKRKYIDFATTVISFINSKRTYQTKRDIVKINIGCGYTVAPGWINVDGGITPVLAKLPSPVLRKFFSMYKRMPDFKYSEREFITLLKSNKFIQHDVSYGLPFKSSVADYIYSSHMLEHLPEIAATHVLKEMHRVLKPKGVLRLVIPDLDYTIALFKQGKKDKALAYYFSKGDNYSIRDRHEYMYDFNMIKQKLKEAGFSNVVRRTHQKGVVPNIELLDNRPEDSLYVEAQK